MRKQMTENGGAATAMGIAMVAAPLAMLISTVIHHPHTGEGGSWLGSAMVSPARFYVAHLLVLVAAALMVPVALGLVAMLRERRPALAYAGAGLTLLGALGIGTLVGMDMIVWQMTDPGADREQMAALIDRVSGSPGAVGPSYLLSSGLVVGPALLAAGLVLERTVSSRQAYLIAVGSTALLGGFPAVGPLAVTGSACMLAGLGSIGFALLRSRSAIEWRANLRRYRILRHSVIVNRGSSGGERMSAEVGEGA